MNKSKLKKKAQFEKDGDTSIQDMMNVRNVTVQVKKIGLVISFKSMANS